MHELQRAPHFLNVVILDACRNNPLASGLSSFPKGLAQINGLPDGTMVLYATAANELAFDGDGRNGILTKNLLAHIKDEGSIDDLFKRVSVGVQADASALGHTQQPALYTNFTGQYCFTRCTDLERLQKQREASEQKISELEARVNAGDADARAELAAAQILNSKLQQDAKAAEKAAQKANKITAVPPAF
jgi:hypothetical protein